MPVKPPTCQFKWILSKVSTENQQCRKNALMYTTVLYNYLSTTSCSCIDVNQQWLGQVNQQREEERRLAHECRMVEEQRKTEREEAERRCEHERQEKERRSEIESRRLIEREKLKLQQLQEQRAMAESLMNCDYDKLSLIKKILE